MAAEPLETFSIADAEQALDEVRDALESGRLPAALVVELAAIARAATQKSAPLSASEQAFIDGHSGTVAASRSLATARLTDASDALTTHHAALTTAQAARLLGRSESRVRHMIREHELIALPSGGRGRARLLPRWQFRDGRPLPHAAKIIAALPAELDPLTVEDFFMRGTVDTATRSTAVADWLFAGGDPAPVVDLARHLDVAL
ncbi:DNA-binding protein [Aeromicrobium phragmitis]|uniref:DNA-binding protein n=1 Tax=Aeromicrobium phragmitis TaxID=2478914 RepID=A0A3L8PLJ4_9ACTN|nr:helix-turn-helix domain-containing protein [Aeromicrobium phragmitis]RLV56094.1 DNA-binding protein [Aeromicrobium phragmitis]